MQKNSVGVGEKYIEKDVEEIFMSDLERWDPVLVDLVKKKKIDPWNIDIEELVKIYQQKMKNFDFIQHGRGLLTLAILLNLKTKAISDTEIFHDPVDEFWEEFEVEVESESGEIINKQVILPRLNIEPRRTVKHKVTMNDLISAFKKVMESRKPQHTRIIQDKRQVEVKTKLDIGKISETLFTRIKPIIDADRCIYFSELCDKNIEQNIWFFMAMLYLYKQNKIDIHQKFWFGDIIITGVNKNE